METITGVILDVSGSMKQNAGGRIDEEGGPWARSIFKVIDNFVRYDVSPENEIFTVGVGERYGEGVFDVLKTIEQFQTLHMRLPRAYDSILDEFYQLVSSKGATHTQQWAPKKIIKSAVSLEMAASLLIALQSNADFLTYFVNSCLPDACFDVVDKNNVVGSIVSEMQGVFCSAASYIKQANKKQIEEIVQKAIGKIVKKVGSVFSIQKASEILNGCIDEEELTKERIQELMKTVQPFIYGRTPLYQALSETTNIFSNQKYAGYKKLLFVLSDGEPTDQCLPSVLQELISHEVIVVSCFISSGANIQPRKLYDVEKEEWNQGAKFLFKLSTHLSSQLLPRTIFIKRGWDIDISNNETKLFLQVNHPDNIHDVCDLAKTLVCCQDSLSDLLVTVSLDMYINQSTSDVKARDQGPEQTCYAYAAAAVLHLAMKRILGRVDDYPNFDDLKNEMVDEHGKEGAVMLDVLEPQCTKYRLHCKIVDTNGAMKAIVAKRPVVAIFFLTAPEWKKFSVFFRDNRTGILTINDIGERDNADQLSGHAVVFTSYDSKCLRFMNSWGDVFADKGFFRVQNSQVLALQFIDVYWTEKDLLPAEKDHFNKHGATVAQKIIERFKSLQTAEYTCPVCHKSSLVTKYSGTLNEAVCPGCKKSFKSNTDGNILALNMYLTSLAQ